MLIPKVTNQKLLDELDEAEKKAWLGIGRQFGFIMAREKS